MNFKSILVLGLSIATLGLAIPAHAGDTATVVDSTQDAILTGSGNNLHQNNKTKVNNHQTGRQTPGNTGTSVTNGQSADVQGNDNTTRQNNTTNINNHKRQAR